MKDYEKNIASDNLYVLVAQGEHENQDFKYKISDSRKIARTLSAFANTSGGRLLIGVRDNGTLAGVKDEDDIYMIESAAEIFLKPSIDVSVFAHQADGKTIWEVRVPEGREKPYFVDEKEGLVAYFRDEYENFAANAVLNEIWRQELARESKHPVAYSEREELLITFLKNNDRISVSKAARLMKMPRNKTIETLARMVRWEVLDWELDSGQFYYYLS